MARYPRQLTQTCWHKINSITQTLVLIIALQWVRSEGKSTYRFYIQIDTTLIDLHVQCVILHMLTKGYTSPELAHWFCQTLPEAFWDSNSQEDISRTTRQHGLIWGVILCSSHLTTPQIKIYNTYSLYTNPSITELMHICLPIHVFITGNNEF